MWNRGGLVTGLSYHLLTHAETLDGMGLGNPGNVGTVNPSIKAQHANQLQILPVISSLPSSIPGKYVSGCCQIRTSH